MRSTLLTLSFFLAFFAAKTVQAQCGPGEATVRLEINADEYYEEVNWQLTNLSGSFFYGFGFLQDSMTHSFSYCIPENQCVLFSIFDNAYDGIVPDGWYKLYVNDVLTYESIPGADYGYTESVSLNCPPGTACTNPFLMSLGTGATPTGDETWYSFIPDSTGTYILNTCGAACPTKIWVYNSCSGIFLSENQLGTIYFAESGCADGSALSNLNLEGGKEYFIRIRYQTPNCSPSSIPYSLTYAGPVMGCMDPTACNYEPLATISSGICIYPGDPDCPNGPDLTVNEEMLNSTLTFSSINNPDACAVEEGCLRGLGTRYLVEFSTHIKNIGEEDYFIGEPPANITDPSDQFVWDPCHHHWHYMGYADYLLYNSEGYRVPIGSKTGFCVLDLECSDGGIPLYDCDNMGISKGCGDIYDIGLPCQWIDITGIPADDYTMVVRVNWDQTPDKLGRLERTYDNNWAQACFTLTYDGNTPEVVFTNDSCQLYTDCEGVTFGSAQPDCNGICNGPALIGDWNQDTVRNSMDVEDYVSAALAGNSAVSTCNDLHDDGEINVFDAALLQECNVFGDNQQHWIQRFPCQFPTGFQNGQDLVTIRPGTVDTLAKTFDIQIANPFNKILAYELIVSGLVIESIQNLSPEHHAEPLFNPATGRIIALSADQSGIKKNATPSTFLRVNYSTLTGNKVCVEEVISVVNDKYQESSATLADPNCVLVNTVAVGEPNSAPFAVFVQPNPMRESTTVFFENPGAAPMSFTLTDLTGRSLRAFQDFRGESVSIERGELPEGTYIFTIRGEKGSVSGKLVIQ